MAKKLKNEEQAETKPMLANRFVIKNTWIQYKIDNHSKLISEESLYECYECGITTHWKYRTKPYVIPRNIFGCYFLYNDKGDIIYIGKTKNCIRGRIFQHLFTNISVYVSEEEKERIEIKRSTVAFVSYTEVDIKMLDFVEIGLINKYRPILNIQFKNVC